MDNFDDNILPQQDSRIRKFYSQISDITNDWIALEDKLYRKIEMGNLQLKDCA